MTRDCWPGSPRPGSPRASAPGSCRCGRNTRRFSSPRWRTSRTTPGPGRPAPSAAAFSSRSSRATPLGRTWISPGWTGTKSPIPTWPKARRPRACGSWSGCWKSTPINSMSESRESRPSLALRARWAQGFLFLIPAIFCWGLARHEPALLIDDAYITFRYAENLARGLGPVFNPGERGLGTTAPLWAGILAGARLLGFPIPSAALVLGQIFTAATCGLLAWILFRHVAAPLAVLAGLGLALHPDAIFFANSGMETGLSMALVLGSLETALRRRFLAAGVLSGAAFLVRPGGALPFLRSGVLALLQGRKSLVRFAIAAAVLVLPWIIFAMVFYGSPIPQSIAA